MATPPVQFSRLTLPLLRALNLCPPEREYHEVATSSDGSGGVEGGGCLASPASRRPEAAAPIVKLRLSGHKLVGDLSALCATPLKHTLEKLDLSNNVISSALGLAGMENLKELNLSNNQVTSMDNFGLPASLEVLSITGNSLLPDSMISELRANAPNLRVLDVTPSFQWGSPQFIRLKQALPGVAILLDGVQLRDR